MSQLYGVAEDWELPPEARGVDATGYRMRPRHRVKVPRKKGERATDREIVRLFLAARIARDRFIVLLLGRAGLRPGGAAGLQRTDDLTMADIRPGSVGEKADLGHRGWHEVRSDWLSVLLQGGG
ncbi:hypothetical protein [Kitasatospora sp. GP82]|uniref:hypothetical protein n=1 Tax=Kitasatospora sp. GP82 TaxID=3035089 RepID=UPI0024769E86|nr:hypothetical protein [Kitasatospora sp. GP82]MDH6130089.1 integrase [Kitasatospora sp. GP82]